MTPEEDLIFGAFTEWSLVTLERVPTYDYMMNLNVYLNSGSSTVDYTLGCGTLGYLVLTAQPAVFNTNCGTVFFPPKNTGIHPVIPDSAPMAVIVPNSSEPTSTKFVYLTNITRLIRCARRLSVSWSQRNNTSIYWVESSASQKSHVFRFCLTLSRSTQNWKTMTSRKFIG